MSLPRLHEDPRSTPAYSGPPLPPLKMSPTRIVVPDVQLPWLEWLEPLPAPTPWQAWSRVCLHLFLVVAAAGIFVESMLREPPAWLRGRTPSPPRPHVEVKRAEFAEPLGRVPTTAEVEKLSTSGEQIEPRGDLLDDSVE